MLRGLSRAVSISVGGLLACALGAGQTVSTTPAVDFQRQVRPILSDNCFLCHGPDKGTRMANLRLDIREGAYAVRKNGTVIVPGKPDDSLLVKRIFSDNPNFRMPPTFAHKTLTDAQKQTLRRWIEQGAQWKQHWAFIPPVNPSLPEVKSTQWPRNSIDRFVLAKLESNSLSPAPEADRRALIRRVTLDLTGLPPTPAEVDSYLQDRSPTAYEKVVDRLLASPHYGEHRARYWLDAARYADTQGLHIDNYREMWPYRDWVIQAFNRNMPFDQFTIEQLGGDLLPHPTLDQKIASGFHRCNVTTDEGGAIPDEVAAMYAKDRADTTGTVWLGLTVGCATCHDHKFDPIAQKEYYSLTAFFRNTTQNPLDGNIPDTPPIVLVPRAEDRARWQELDVLQAQLRQGLEQSEQSSNQKFEKWLKSSGRSKVTTYDKASRIVDLQIDGPVEALTHDKPIPLALPAGVTRVDGMTPSQKALEFGKDASLPLPGASRIDTGTPFTISTWIYVSKAKDSSAIASQFDSAKKRGWVLELNTGNFGGSDRAPALRLMGDDGKFLSARPGPGAAFKPESWYHITFTYDGSRDRKGLALYVNGQAVRTFGTGEDTRPLASSMQSTAPLLLGSYKTQHFTGGRIGDFRILNRAVDAEDAELLYLASTMDGASKKSPAALSDAERRALRTFYERRIDHANRKAEAQLRLVNAEQTAIARRGATTFVMQERSDSKPVAHVLYRGQYDVPKDEVTPGVLAVLPPMAQSLPRNRLGLAEWLVDPSNPLTARVTVNRFWQEVFGTGLVKTVEDFGSQGEPPSHPELLDWLAINFRDSHWDVKGLFRLIVTSAAYRQSAVTTEDKLQRDPDNRLLSRGPRFRMDGEMVRDCALAASSLLQPAIGGPSVKPYQPMNIWETVAMDVSNTRVYTRDTGAALYRRSLYTFWKRSAPPASMDIFNAPSRETCVVRRERTNTPLQALVTMNDPQFVEAARVLAQNALLSSQGQLKSQVDFMAVRLLARDLQPNEFEAVARSYKDYLSYYETSPQDAVKLLKVGESVSNASLPKAEFAAMTMVANELMNLDEVLAK